MYMLPYLLISLLSWVTLRFDSPSPTQLAAKGFHPVVCTNARQEVEVVYGLEDRIYYTASKNQGQTYTPAEMVDTLKDLFLVAQRRPQIASNGQVTLIIALNKAGNIFAYSRDKKTGKWTKRIRVSDQPDIAKEGFVSVAAGPDNMFYAVWNDLRGKAGNKVVGSRSLDGGKTWSANQILYQSPDGPICPCCSPSVAIEGKQVYITFRNSLGGYRDIHLLTSSDGGQHFGQPQKLGTGSWKLEGCPMDGGGIAIPEPGHIVTAWRREDRIYVAEPGQPEREVARGGKNVALAANAQGNFIVWQADGKIWAITPQHPTPVSLGPGAFARVAALSRQAVCVWETENGLLATTLK